MVKCSVLGEEITTLSYGLDTHIATNTNRIAIATSFETFFLKDISRISESELRKIKTKHGNT